MSQFDGTVTPWITDARRRWFADVTDWLTEVTTSLGLGSITDVTSVRERPWSAVLRVVTTQRVTFFKAEGLGGWHEPPLLAHLAPEWPDLVPEVLAVDEARSWLLMSDHGHQMFGAVDGPEELAIFERLLPRYARMQQASPAMVESLISAGAPDRRMRHVPKLFDRLLNEEVHGGRVPIGPALRAAIERIVPELHKVCDELAGTAAADALDHGDLHDGNVLVGAGPPRLVDWGDSCVTHPFSSLFVTYDVAIPRMRSVDKHRAALRLRDAYLDAWTTTAPKSALRRTFTLAVWMAHVSRAMDYVHMLNGATPETKLEWYVFITDLLGRWVSTHELLARGDELLFAVVESPPS